MLEFKYSTPQDKQWIDEVLSKSRHMGCIYSFAQTFIWANKYNTKVCRYKDALLIMGGYEEKAYMYPAGDYDIHEIIEVLRQDSRERGIPFVIAAAEEWQMQELAQAYPDEFEFTEDRDSFDYIYLASDLINLAGRKYHGKRNHIAKFMRRYPECVYENINKDNLCQCVDAAKLWYEQNKDKEGLDQELAAIKRAADHFEEFGFVGGMLKIDGKAVAFTMGERLNKDIFVVHFEKALEGYEEAYTVINNRFASECLSGYTYINREEDMGIEGLRKAKLSYRPHILLKKYLVCEVAQ